MLAVGWGGSYVMPRGYKRPFGSTYPVAVTFPGCFSASLTSHSQAVPDPKSAPVWFSPYYRLGSTGTGIALLLVSFHLPSLEGKHQPESVSDSLPAALPDTWILGCPKVSAFVNAGRCSPMGSSLQHASKKPLPATGDPEVALGVLGSWSRTRAA